MTIDQIRTILLKNRGLTTPAEVDEFFSPTHPSQLPTPFTSQPAIDLITKHIQANNKIAIYGDYDVDGVCSTAILWETLHSYYSHVFPHIPHRESEGYGLSTQGIDHCLQMGAKLIIAIDNGIVAHTQAQYCKDHGCDLLIIDHHESDGSFPPADVILHSTSCCATALAWFFCRDLSPTNKLSTEHLALVAIATICDLMPLLSANRSLVKFGLLELNTTTRPGLLSLFELARLVPGEIGTYQVGFIIGPRLNAMGRLEHAIDSLRLICTTNLARAKELAQVLDQTNRERQTETDLSITHAITKYGASQPTGIILSADVSYHPGVIGLIAARLVENYYRPSIAISIGETESKGSGRSIAGFHLTDFLRQHEHLFSNLGGHAMACGFTIPTTKIDDLFSILTAASIDPDLLVKKQRLDTQIPLDAISWDLWQEIQRFEPFGIANPTPIFQSEANISEIKAVGREGKHLKFKANNFEAIWFNAIQPLDDSSRTLTYSLVKNTWNGNSNLQLVVKSVHV